MRDHREDARRREQQRREGEGSEQPDLVRQPSPREVDLLVERMDVERGQIRIDASQSAADRLDRGRRGAASPHEHRATRIGELLVRRVEIRLKWMVVEWLIRYVAHDADDLGARVGRIEVAPAAKPDALAYRIFARPKTPGRVDTDDGHARAPRAVCRLEDAAAQQRHTERPEVVGRDIVPKHAGGFTGLRDRSPRDVQRAARASGTDGRAPVHRRAFDIGERPDLVEHAVDEGRRFRHRISHFRGTNPEGEQMRPVEADVSIL